MWRRLTVAGRGRRGRGVFVVAQWMGWTLVHEAGPAAVKMQLTRAMVVVGEMT